MPQRKQKDNIDKEDLTAIRRSFDVLDRDENGRISDLELMKGIQVLGFNPTLSEARDMIEEVDKNGNGHIEFSEYEELMIKRLKSLDREDELMRNAFKRFDKDGDGFISAKELRKVLCGCGEHKLSNVEADDFFKEADVDGDGKICYEEFVKAFCSM